MQIVNFYTNVNFFSCRRGSDGLVPSLFRRRQRDGQDLRGLDASTLRRKTLGADRHPQRDRRSSGPGPIPDRTGPACDALYRGCSLRNDAMGDHRATQRHAIVSLEYLNRYT